MPLTKFQAEINWRVASMLEGVYDVLDNLADIKLAHELNELHSLLVPNNEPAFDPLKTIGKYL